MGRPRKRWTDVVEDDLLKGRLYRGLAKDRDSWRAQMMGKTSDVCEHEKRDVNFPWRQRMRRENERESAELNFTISELVNATTQLDATRTNVRKINAS